MKSFVELGVAEPICHALQAEKYVNPTPIQAQAIPLLLEGRDLLGIAQTGTGKTAAFVIPLLQRGFAQRPSPRSTRALILAPTRELAIQIGDAVKTYGRHLGLRYTVILGGVGQNQQVQAMANGVDILIATPGRLLDLVNQRHVRLDEASYFVLDEADRMLDMGFIRDVRKIVAKLPKERQSMLFSATMPDDVAKIAHDILNDPARVHVTPAVVIVDKVDQHVYFVAGGDKRTLLSQLLQGSDLARVIVFTRTKHGANRVAEHLTKTGVSSDAIHGNKSQGARQRALDRFRSGNARVLVATDIAARGIDVDGITHVINFELPNVPESYVHRIGRTARAGAAGVALSFCDPSERSFLRDIERLTQRPMSVITHGLNTSQSARPSEDHGDRGDGHRGRNGNGRGRGQHGSRHGGQRAEGRSHGAPQHRHGQPGETRPHGDHAPRHSNGNDRPAQQPAAFGEARPQAERSYDQARKRPNHPPRANGHGDSRGDGANAPRHASHTEGRGHAERAPRHADSGEHRGHAPRAHGNGEFRGGQRHAQSGNGGSQPRAVASDAPGQALPTPRYHGQKHAETRDSGQAPLRRNDNRGRARA